MTDIPTNDFKKNWSSFCDADQFEGREDFAERMEAAGLIELVPVDNNALDDAFAAQRGIEKGGFMWRATDAGLRVLRP